VYTSDFSAGVDGWSPTSAVTIAGNIDGIGGEDNWLRVTRTAAGSGLITVDTKLGVIAPSKNNRLSIKFHNPVGSGITHLGIGGYGASGVVAISEGNTATLNIPYFIASSATFVTITARDAAGVAVNVANGSIYYFKEVVSGVNGLTSELLASNAQSNTGQILDSSGNKNHAMLPASGATVVGRPVSQTREVRWTNTWAGTNELQYIGGVNQAIIPANAYIESIIGTVSGATPHDIIIGDGSDTDRYVTITTGLAAGTTSFTLASRTTDGTNLKLTVDPDTDATMSIAWVIRYSVLE
jgi:hypothetical protein